MTEEGSKAKCQGSDASKWTEKVSLQNFLIISILEKEKTIVVFK